MQDIGDALQPHPRIHTRRGEGFIKRATMRGVGLGAVELHEDQIPNFQEAIIVLLKRLNDGLFATFGVFIPVNLGVGSARSRFRHLPEVVLRP